MGYRNTLSPSTSNNYSTTTVESYSNINIKHLYGVAANTRDQDFDLKMRMTAYWKMVLKRLVDRVALHLCFVIQKVPKCIEKLTHAGIKIWVLTSHKDMYYRRADKKWYSVGVRRMRMYVGVFGKSTKKLDSVSCAFSQTSSGLSPKRCFFLSRGYHDYQFTLEDSTMQIACGSNKIIEFHRRSGYSQLGTKSVLIANHFLPDLADKELNQYNLMVIPSSTKLNKAIMSHLDKVHRITIKVDVARAYRLLKNNNVYTRFEC
ncbi:hypothetical protein Tco_0434771 [Tanacetum coccineum]